MIKALRFFYIFIFACAAHAEELPSNKIFPPYPDVWGYDVTEFPAIPGGKAGIINAYRMPDGDIWFVIAYLFKYKDPKGGSLGGYADRKYILLKFFKDELITLDGEQRDDLYKITEGRQLSKINSIVHFKDGSTLTYFSGPSPKACFLPQFIRSYYVKTDINNHKKKYSILGVSPHVNVWEDEALCEAQGADFFYGRLYLSDMLIDLGDDTFITYTDSSNLILRFDKQLNTQFNPVNSVTTSHDDLISRNFFVVEYSVIEELLDKYAAKNVPVNQTVHDKLLLYFKEKYK